MYSAQLEIQLIDKTKLHYATSLKIWIYGKKNKGVFGKEENIFSRKCF